MSRNHTYSALVLRVKPSGEANRDAWFLTAEEGIVIATVFGGPKSKLRAYVAPFHRGTLWLYRNPVRDTWKVTDFDVRVYRLGIRELYERSVTATTILETILVTKAGGGNWPLALALADAALDALDSADEACCKRILVHFHWNWAELLGVRPSLRYCGSCGAEVPLDGSLWFSRQEGVLLCQGCRGFSVSGRELFLVGPGARRWLGAVESLSP
jgi:DNA repair protein RecO (recombination protein O)